jgi:Mycobacterium membrane protein
MTRLIGRAWVPIVMVIGVAVRAFTVSRFQGVFGSHWSVPAFGTADLIVQFKPKGVICVVYGPAGRVAAGALRWWSQRASDAGEPPRY